MLIWGISLQLKWRNLYGVENSLFWHHEWQPENQIFIQGAFIIYSHDANHKQRVYLSLAWRYNSLSNFERYAILASGSLSITLGSRDFSCAVSGFGVFGLLPNTCRLAADETKLPDAREKKPLVPRVPEYQVRSCGKGGRESKIITDAVTAKLEGLF